jgi:hypothetical protein
LSAQLKALLNGPLARVPGLQRVLASSLDQDALWELSLKMVLCQGNSAFKVSPFVTRPVRDIYWGCVVVTVTQPL